MIEEKTFKEKIEDKFSIIKNKGIVGCLFKNRYEELKLEYHKIIYEEKNYYKYQEILQNRKTNLIDKLIIRKLVEFYIQESYDPLVLINWFNLIYPFIFNFNFISYLYIKTKARIFYYLENSLKNNEELIMKFIRNEYFLKIFNMEYYLFNKASISLYELLDKNFKIRKDKNKFLIKKFYPKYIFLLSGIIREKEISTYFKKERIFHKKIFPWVNRKIILKEDKLFFLKKLLENKNKSPEVLTDYLKNEFIDSYYLLESLNKELGLNYLYTPINNLNIYKTSEQIKIIKMYPSLMIFEDINYKTKTNFNEMLNILLNTYAKEETNAIKWDLNRFDLDNLKFKIKEKLEENHSDIENFIDEEIMSNFIKFDIEVFCDIYFKNKYSNSMIEKVKTIPISISSDFEIDNDLSKILIFQNAYINDLEKMETKIINNYLNNNDLEFEFACNNFLSNPRISNERKGILLERIPKLTKTVIISEFFTKKELITLIDNNYKIYKYSDHKIRVDWDLALIAISKDIKILKEIPKTLLYDKNFLKEILNINKYYLDDILKLMSSSAVFDYKNIEDNILNAYLTTEDDKYLKYLPEEIIETYLFLGKINIDEIKNKKSKKKVKKIANRMKDILN